MQIQNLHIAIIETEVTPKNVVATHGTQGEIIERLLQGACADLGLEQPQLTISKWNAVRETPTYPDFTTVNGLFFTGGGYSAYDDYPWATELMHFMREAYGRGIPMVGICYGFQLLSRALGGKVALNPLGRELGVRKIELTHLGKQFIGSDSLYLHQMHLDAVVETPPETQIIGSSDLCSAQLVYQPKRLLGIQGHPELDAALSQHNLDIRLSEGLIDEETHREATSRVNEAHDGRKFAMVIYKFFVESDALRHLDWGQLIC